MDKLQQFPHSVYRALQDFDGDSGEEIRSLAVIRTVSSLAVYPDTDIFFGRFKCDRCEFEEPGPADENPFG